MSSGIHSYRLIRLVHEGLYGPMHQAEELATRKTVALQLLPGARDEAALPVLEAQVLALDKLQPPLVRRPLSVGKTPEGGLYVAWEWSDAQPLHLPLANPRYALPLVHQLADALEGCHGHGVIHGFLRPSQLLVQDERGTLSLRAVLGLGLQRALGLPASTLRPDTIAFLAPELRNGATAEEPSADLFGLGQVLRALLGIPVGKDRDEPVPEGAGSLSREQRQDLHDLLKQLLQPNPALRPALRDVKEVLRALQQAKRMTVKTPLDRALADTPLSSEARAADPLLGQTFGSFRLTRCIGRGGMGAVYEAKHRLIGTRAAVKILLPELGAEDDSRRFLDEARAVNIVSHPGVVSIFEFGQRDEDNRLYIVMEYLQGQSLEAYLTERKRVGYRDLLPVLLQLTRAIEVAHRSGIIHRDLKPSNVMLVSDPLVPGGLRVKVVDFGIAKVRRSRASRDDETAIGAVMGTPCFMAPEQYGNAAEVTGKADVFALGVILYEALSGQLPFGQASTLSVVNRPAPPLRSQVAAVPLPLASLVDSMLRSEPDERPAMAEVAAELERIYRTPVRRWPRLVSAGAAGTLAGAVALVFIGRSRSLEEIERQSRSIREHASRILRAELAPERPSQVRSAAARALGSSRDTLYRDWLIPLVKDPDKQVACAAGRALSAIGDPAEGPLLSGLLDHPDLSLRLCAASALTLLTASAESKLGQDVARALLQDPRVSASSELAEVRAALAADLLQAGSNGAASTLLQVAQSPALSAAARIHYLELVAATEEAPVAVARLRQIATDVSRPASETLGALASLIRLGFGQAEERQVLQSAREQSGPNQLLATWLARGIPDSQRCARFWTVLSSSAEAEERRQLAADGLSHCGHVYADKLDPLLDSLAPRPLLRISVAESLLRLVGPDPRRAAELQHSFAQGYRNGAALGDRLAFIDSLSGLPSAQVISSITHILQEEGDETVRRIAARNLSPEQVRSALQKLAEDLEGASGDVSDKGQQAIAALLRQLQLDMPPVLGASVRTRILQRLQSAHSPTEEVILRMLLLRAGERDQSALLRSKLPTLDRLHRLLAIELCDPNDLIVTSALSAPDSAVQFAAARRRALHMQDDAATRQVLTAALTRRGSDSLVAFHLLRSLGARPERPAHLNDLLGRAEALPVRWEAVRILAFLPLAEALPLLLEASDDPSVVIRREVIQVARAHFNRSRDLQLVDLVRFLASDPELPVRLRAAQFLLQIVRADGTGPQGRAPALPQAPANTSEPSRAQPLSGTAVSPTEATAKDRASLQFQMPLGFRARVTGKGFAQEAVPGKEIPVPPGRYQVTASCDETLTFEIKATERRLVKLCEVTQAVEQIRLMRQSGQLAQASAALGRLLAQLRGKEQSTQYDRVRFERGELRAASGNLREALDDYNHVWGRHLGKPLAQHPTIEQKFTLLKAQVGRLSVYQQTGGRCTLIEDSLQMPGQVRTALLTEGVPIRTGEHVVRPTECRGQRP